MRKAILLALFLATVASANGCFVILNYTQSTFEKSGSNLSAATSSIIVASVQLIGSLLGIKYIDRYGRRVLLLISLILTSLSFFVFGGYSFLEFMEVNVGGFKWIPVFCLSFSIFVASFGTMSVPFFAIPEILPEKV
jgi:MFS family permease